MIGTRQNNQYYKGNIRPKTKKSVMYVVYVTTLLLIAILAARAKSAEMDVKIISPLAVRAFASDGVGTPVLSQRQIIENEIKDVFGQYSPKALQLLTCENGNLWPNAVNSNTDGSRDFGIFQINNKWQGVSNEAFLLDFHINIRMAYNIFSRDHYSFKLWTCGRRMGI